MRAPLLAGLALTGSLVAAACTRPLLPETYRVDLGPGRAVETFPIHARDPAAHTFTVRVALPPEAAVRITMRTASGATIHVLDPVRRRACHRRTRVDVCVYHFPALEAQPGGIWIVSVRKQSRAPATVRFSIEFEPVG